MARREDPDEGRAALVVVAGRVAVEKVEGAVQAVADLGAVDLGAGAAEVEDGVVRRVVAII
jgi:hypothetical protein